MTNGGELSPVKRTIRVLLGLPIGANLKTHRTYRIWYAMRQRCSYKRHHARMRYADKGITVAPRWNRFEYFLADMGHPPSNQHSIDRIDNDKGYGPGNCRWATRTEQQRNRRCNVDTGGRGNLKALADANGIAYGTVWRRLQRGWPLDRALTQRT